MEDFNKVHRTYQKINTLYKRDEKNNIIIGDFSKDEFKYLFDNEWLAFEKIDGTNMSWYWDGHELQIHGKSEKAQIMQSLADKMRKILTVDKLISVFPPKIDKDGNEIPFLIRIYGEGYGKKIQKGGNYIKDDVNVRVFDIMINGWWLKWNDVKDICDKLGLETVPEFGVMTLRDAEKKVMNGFKSTISENKDYDAEGIVLRPIVQLYDKSGERIIVKVKTCDYRKIGK